MTSIELADGSLMYAGDEMIVMLGGNATTGYEWTSSVEGAAVSTDMDDYVAGDGTTEDEGADEAAGAGGVHTFGYRAHDSGDATITLTYARSWEQTPDDKTVVIKASVNDGSFAQVTVE